MLFCNEGDVVKTNGKEFIIGMEINCNDKSDYPGISGKIIEIRDDDDREDTANEVEIVCELSVPSEPEITAGLVKRFSEIYGREVVIEELGLDYVMLTPEKIDIPRGENTNADISAETDNTVKETETGNNTEGKESAEKTETNGNSKTKPQDKSAEEKKKEHEESEKKRKAEFDKKQAAKKAAEDEAMKKMQSMSGDELAAASVKKLGDDTERLTRRNMKICVTEHIQKICGTNLEFARKTMHPRKSMMNCFKYITRLALEYIKKEREDNGNPATAQDMGGDVPDDVCYKWAEDYFNDADAPEDKKEEDKFVPKPFYGGGSSKSKTNAAKTTNTQTKIAGKAKEITDSGSGGQMSLMDQMSLEDAG